MTEPLGLVQFGQYFGFVNMRLEGAGISAVVDDDFGPREVAPTLQRSQ